MSLLPPTRSLLLLSAIMLLSQRALTQTPTQNVVVTAHLQLAPARKTHAHEGVPTAVLWLNPLGAEPAAAQPRHSFTMLQRNKMFSPHLLVIPVGSVVYFPNKDPFFHNVFSLFDGKRFDLGLYEAGSTREVTFSREGVSYVFCNIHPQMSSVILSLSTTLYSIADSQHQFRLNNVPPGAYELHVWIEGEPQTYLETLTHRILISSTTDLGTIVYTASGRAVGHTNKFNQPYDQKTSHLY